MATDSTALNSGIVPELRAVLDLAMGNELDAPRMLGLVMDLLTKAIQNANRGGGDALQAVEAAAAVVSAIQKYLENEATHGLAGSQASIVNRLHSDVASLIANSASFSDRMDCQASGERERVVQVACSEWDGMNRSSKNLTDRSSHVSMCLQDRGMGRLTTQEAQAIDLVAGSR